MVKGGRTWALLLLTAGLSGCQRNDAPTQENISAAVREAMQAQNMTVCTPQDATVGGELDFRPDGETRDAEDLRDLEALGLVKVSQQESAPQDYGVFGQVVNLSYTAEVTPEGQKYIRNGKACLVNVVFDHLGKMSPELVNGNGLKTLSTFVYVRPEAAEGVPQEWLSRLHVAERIREGGIVARLILTKDGWKVQTFERSF